MTELDIRVTNLEKLAEECKNTESRRWEKCVFCVNDKMSPIEVTADRDHNRYLVAEEVVRKTYQIKTGKEKPRASDPLECEHDSWLKNNSLDVAHFLAVIQEVASSTNANPENQKSIDENDPKNIISNLVKKLEQKKGLWKEEELRKKQITSWCMGDYPPELSLEELLSQIKKTRKEAEFCLKIVGKDSLLKLNPQRFDRCLLDIEDIVRKYSPHRSKL